MEGFISIRQVMDDIMNHPMLRDVTLERVVNYAYAFIRIVGCNKLFVNKFKRLHISEFRAVLPCDYISMIQVRGANDEEYRYTTDNFHTARQKDWSTEYTYKIQGSVIYTSIEEGCIDISYKAVELDEDGFPLIPDNESFKKALELYVKKEAFTVLFDLGKINFNVLDNVQKEYSWYVGQAQTSLIKPTIDEMESFTRMWNTLIPRMREHKKEFQTLGDREFIRRH